LPDNGPSRAVLRKVGFREEGIARHYLKINGKWHDHLLFDCWSATTGPCMGAEPRPAVLAARRGYAAVLATRLVPQAVLATCVLIGALPSLAQSTSAERDAPFCDDFKRLMRAADEGFAPFIKEPNENYAKSAQVLHYWAVPVKGFASARIAQATRRTAGD